MDSKGTCYTKFYDKRDDFNVLQSSLPILATINVWSVSQHTVRYSRACGKCYDFLEGSTAGGLTEIA